MLTYKGGKKRQAAAFAQILADHRSPGQAYFEPFLGMGAVMLATTRIGDKWPTTPQNRRVGNDIDPDVCALWTAAKAGWRPSLQPPSHAQQQQYWSNTDAHSAHKTFTLIACGFSGQKGAGFYPDRWQLGVRGYMKALPAVTHVNRVTCRSYDDKVHARLHDTLVYADPPYEGTSCQGYNNLHKATVFNWPHFWNIMHQWAQQRNTVFVSWVAETPIPIPHRIVWTKTGVRTTQSARSHTTPQPPKRQTTDILVQI